MKNRSERHEVNLTVNHPRRGIKKVSYLAIKQRLFGQSISYVVDIVAVTRVVGLCQNLNDIQADNGEKNESHCRWSVFLSGTSKRRENTVIKEKNRINMIAGKSNYDESEVSRLSWFGGRLGARRE
jgi:hypothetical protein